MQASIASRGVNMPCPMLGQNGCAYSYTYVCLHVHTHTRGGSRVHHCTVNCAPD